MIQIERDIEIDRDKQIQIEIDSTKWFKVLSAKGSTMLSIKKQKLFTPVVRLAIFYIVAVQPKLF